MIKFNQPTSPITGPQRKIPAIRRDTSSPASAAASEFMPVKQAASYLRVSKSFLDKLRVQGDGPEFIRLGARKILYRKADLEAWTRQRRFQSTAEYPAPK